jgi:transposase-like protein
VRHFFRDKSVMSTLTLAKKLIATEQAETGAKLPEAIKAIARDAGILPGTLYNLLRGRLKHTDRIAGSIHELRIKKLEQRIASLQHELDMARISSAVPEIDLERAEVALEEARRAIGKV